MCNVYSFSGFAKVLIKNGITFSIRDFLDDKKVDELIQKLVDKTCDSYSWVGAGIARSCFIDPYDLAAIKVDKNFYVDLEDYQAEEEWQDLHWRDNKEDYDPYGYALDNLSVVIKLESYCEQCKKEIDDYTSYLKTKSKLLQYVPVMYAVSSNKAVEIMEFCRKATWEDFQDQSDRERIIAKRFSDTHDDNFGINKSGLLVLLDYGF